MNLWEHKDAFDGTVSVCPKCGAFALYKYCSSKQVESHFCPNCGKQLKDIEDKNKKKGK